MLRFIGFGLGFGCGGGFVGGAGSGGGVSWDAADDLERAWVGVRVLLRGRLD